MTTNILTFDIGGTFIKYGVVCGGELGPVKKN